MDPENKTSLKKVMHGLCMSYAKHFNYKYHKCGHLWQGRYKSFVIQKDKYLVNCMTYIETNPVRVGICQRAEEYPWSSYSSRILGKGNMALDDFVA
jgi:putative transposase